MFSLSLSLLPCLPLVAKAWTLCNRSPNRRVKHGRHVTRKVATTHPSALSISHFQLHVRVHCLTAVAVLILTQSFANSSTINIFLMSETSAELYEDVQSKMHNLGTKLEVGGLPSFDFRMG
jgi:hypothetical protein